MPPSPDGPSNLPQFRQFEPPRRAGVMSHSIDPTSSEPLTILKPIVLILKPHMASPLQRAGASTPAQPTPAKTSPTPRPIHNAACPNAECGASQTRGPPP